MSQSLESIEPKSRESDEKIPITEDDYLELLDSKNLRLGEFQG